MKITVTAKALDQIKNLPPRIQRQIWDNINELMNFPNCTGTKKLTGDRRGQWSKRTGDYRIIFIVDFEKEIITIIEVFHRGDGY